MRLLAEFSVKIICKHHPPTELSADGNKRMFLCGDFLRSFADPAPAGCGSPAFQVVVGSDDFLPTFTLHAADAPPVRPISLLQVILKNLQQAEYGSDGDKRMAFYVVRFRNRFSSA
jgi:hypothetical protein